MLVFLAQEKSNSRSSFNYSFQREQWSIALSFLFSWVKVGGILCPQLSFCSTFLLVMCIYTYIAYPVNDEFLSKKLPGPHNSALTQALYQVCVLLVMTSIASAIWFQEGRGFLSHTSITNEKQ